ncbi:MAG TPA: OmpA family protein [Pyrinomonadaceae bacterium]|jgi:outer membrane protein OmpA-like peptidoglycan-associated protein|nr:OmpA family protein [Pyrinomonadaceae bacterium]
MRTNRPIFARRLAVAFVFVLTASFGALAQNQVPNGQKLKIQGIVIERDGESFTVQDLNSVETVAVLNSSTKVRTHKNGIFRGGTSYAATNILRGLRVQVEGVGNAEGRLVADTVKFDERDLRTAQALQRVQDQADRNSALSKANAELAKSNQERITRAEENEQRLAGMIAENTALINENRALVNKAQATADDGVKSATVANTRITALDEFEPVRTVTVNFRPGSAVLSSKAKQEIEAAAEWVKTQNTKGWVVSVAGFADTTGNTAGNRSLSDRRAKAVLDYLLTEHNLTLQRLDQPFGYGESKPLAANTTAEGRAQNRRVEIRLLVNKGIAAPSAD